MICILLYVNDMLQTANYDLFLYADDSYLIYQHRGVKVIEQKLNKKFLNVCSWFADSKLSLHFGEDKTKSILFGTKKETKTDRNLDTKYGTIHIKQ